jgi:predicted acylesterase/phospholipase RssA
MTEINLVDIAQEKDEAKLSAFFANLENLRREENDGSTVFHLAALANNAEFFNAAVAAMKTADVDHLGTLSMYLAAQVDGLTPVHVAVAAKAVDVLKMLSYWQRQYENVGYQAALGTPADETKRPAALAEKLYGPDHEISQLVHVIKDAAGVTGRALGYEYACQFVARNPGSPIQPGAAPAGGLRVLSLDGGGSRGVIAIGALTRLQKELPEGVYVGDLFDVICGTSTGAIIAAAIVYLRMPLDQLKAMYINLAQGMFGSESFAEKVFNGAKYSTDGLRKTLRTLLPSVHLSDVPIIWHADQLRPVFIATAATEDDWNAHHVFGNYVRRADSQVPFPLINDCAVWQACRATSAAPTFFVPKQLEKDGTKFVDGGVYANNPINVAVREARAVFGFDVKFRAIVSLGCGFASDEETSKSVLASLKDGVVGVLKTPLPEIAFSGVRAVNMALELASNTIRHHKEFLGHASPEMLAVYTRLTLPLRPEDAKLDVGDAKILNEQYDMGYEAMGEHAKTIAARIRDN